jgi:hypothetical protein
MIKNAVYRDLVAMQNSKHAFGNASLGEHLGEQNRNRWVFLAGLEDECVTCGDRVGEHPHGHHGRKVEWGDSGYDTKWLANRVHVDPA